MSQQEPIPRAAMSPEERQARSRLAQLANNTGFVRGTLQVRYRRCGRPECRCARGQKHRGVYLVVSRGGGRDQIYVPPEWEETVRQWVRNYHQIRDLMEQVSDQYQEKIRRRQG